MWRIRVRHTLHGALGREWNRMRLSRRQPRCDRRLIRIQVPADLHMKSLALKLKIGERVVGDEADEFPQFFHVDRGFEMLRQRAMPATTAISITMTTLRARLARVFGTRL